MSVHVIHIYVNTSNLSDDDNNPLKILNGTLIDLNRSVKFKDSDLHELLYVVIVIMFYAMALMVMIATQIRKQRREGTEVDYYDEYLQRNAEAAKSKKSQLVSTHQAQVGRYATLTGLESIRDEDSIQDDVV
jgi:hypothetical protein